MHELKEISLQVSSVYLLPKYVFVITWMIFRESICFTGHEIALPAIFISDELIKRYKFADFNIRPIIPKL